MYMIYTNTNAGSLGLDCTSAKLEGSNCAFCAREKSVYYVYKASYELALKI